MTPMERIVITGASRGIGLELARQFAARGDVVFATCRNPETAGRLRALSAGIEDRFHAPALDVSDEESIRQAADWIGARVSGIDILINNAGCFAPGEDGIENVRIEPMARTFAVNAFGPVLVTKRFLPLLRGGIRPRVVNITSGAGVLWDEEGQPGRQYSYGASKAALNQLTRSLAFDLKPHGITVVGLGPGFVRTDMTRGRNAPLTPEQSAQGMIALIERIGLEQAGRFYDWTGRECDWMKRKPSRLPSLTGR